MQLKPVICIIVAMLFACQSKTRLPLDRDIVHINISSENIVCAVKKISIQQGLDFHFGTSIQSFGNMNTFRLIGDGYEITMVNASNKTDYDIRVYNMTDNTEIAKKAKSQFNKFRREVILGDKCKA